MQRNSNGTSFPPPCLKFSSHFLVLSAFPTSKVRQCFICLKKNPIFVFNTSALLGLARLLVCAVFRNKKRQQPSLLVQWLCSFSVSSGYSLFGILGISQSMSPFLPISAALTGLWHIVQFSEKCHLCFPLKHWNSLKAIHVSDGVFLWD